MHWQKCPSSLAFDTLHGVVERDSGAIQLAWRAGESSRKTVCPLSSHYLQCVCALLEALPERALAEEEHYHNAIFTMHEERGLAAFGWLYKHSGQRLSERLFAAVWVHAGMI